MSATTEYSVRHVEGAWTRDASGEIPQPAWAARVLADAGDPRELLRRHGVAARRIALGRQILKIAGKVAPV